MDFKKEHMINGGHFPNILVCLKLARSGFILEWRDYIVIIKRIIICSSINASLAN